MGVEAMEATTDFRSVIWRDWPKSWICVVLSEILSTRNKQLEQDYISKNWQWKPLFHTERIM